MNSLLSQGFPEGSLWYTEMLCYNFWSMIALISSIYPVLYPDTQSLISSEPHWCFLVDLMYLFFLRLLLNVSSFLHTRYYVSAFTELDCLWHWYENKVLTDNGLVVWILPRLSKVFSTVLGIYKMKGVWLQFQASRKEHNFYYRQQEQKSW